MRKLEHKARGKEIEAAEEERQRQRAEMLQLQARKAGTEPAVRKGQTVLGSTATLHVARGNSDSPATRVDMFDGILRRGGTMAPRLCGGSPDLEASLKLRPRPGSQPGRGGSAPRPEQPLNAEEGELPET